MDTAFVQELLKKDEDTQIQEIKDSGGAFVITTDVDLEEAGMVVRQGPTLGDLVDDELLARERKRRLVPVEIRMVRFVFGIQMMTALFVATLGYIVYYILNYDETRHVARIAFVVSFVCVGLEYAAMVATRTLPDYVVAPLLLLFIFTVAVWCGALSSIAHNIVPLQSCASVMVQSCAVYAYTLEEPGNQVVDPLYVGGYMAVGHVVAWLVGIFVFVRQSDWVWALALLGFGMGYAMYGVWQIANITRYCLSQRDRMMALVHFYIDPVVQFQHIVRSIRKHTQPVVENEESS